MEISWYAADFTSDGLFSGIKILYLTDLQQRADFTCTNTPNTLPCPLLTLDRVGIQYRDVDWS